jgi:hypothetical protein
MIGVHETKVDELNICKEEARGWEYHACALNRAVTKFCLKSIQYKQCSHLMENHQHNTVPSQEFVSLSAEDDVVPMM